MSNNKNKSKGKKPDSRHSNKWNNKEQEMDSYDKRQTNGTSFVRPGDFGTYEESTTVHKNTSVKPEDSKNERDSKKPAQGTVFPDKSRIFGENIYKQLEVQDKFEVYEDSSSELNNHPMESKDLHDHSEKSSEQRKNEDEIKGKNGENEEQLNQKNNSSGQFLNNNRPQNLSEEKKAEVYQIHQNPKSPGINVQNQGNNRKNRNQMKKIESQKKQKVNEFINQASSMALDKFSEIFFDILESALIEDSLYDLLNIECMKVHLDDCLMNYVIREKRLNDLEIHYENLANNVVEGLLVLIFKEIFNDYVQKLEEKIEAIAEHVEESLIYIFINDSIIELVQLEIISDVTEILINTWNVKQVDANEKRALFRYHDGKNLELSLIEHEVNKLVSSSRDSFFDDQMLIRKKVYNGVVRRLQKKLPILLNEKQELFDYLYNLNEEIDQKYSERQFRLDSANVKIKEFQYFECSLKGAREIFFSDHYTKETQKNIESIDQNIRNSIRTHDVSSLRREFEALLNS